MLETSLLQQPTVVVHAAALQGPLDAGEMDSVHAEVINDADAVEFRSRLHQPGEDQLEERLILDLAKAQPLSRAADHLDQQP